MRDVDLTVLVVDATDAPGFRDRFVLDALERERTSVILALNKVDATQKPRLLPLIEK